MKETRAKNSGFTIVELLIVIVIIGILATIVIIAYNGITNKAQNSVLQSDLKNASTDLEITNATDGSYPSSGSSLKSSPNTTLSYNYSASDNTYCLQASSTKTTSIYHVTSSSAISSGKCPLTVVLDGNYIQDITNTNCPNTRTRAVDARDNHTYWVQKLADGKCWMLTNLAYAGGGTNTYSDAIPTSVLFNGTGGLYGYTPASYYVIPSTTNFTVEPAYPSASTDGTGQYGYLYNWCAVMGGQATAACSGSSTTPTPVATITICPAGWRPPTGGSSGELTSLNTAINSGSTTSPAGLLSSWLAQYGGYWAPGFSGQGTVGGYWSSTQSTAMSAYFAAFSGTTVTINSSLGKLSGRSVRCVAAA